MVKWGRMFGVRGALWTPHFRTRNGKERAEELEPPTCWFPVLLKIICTLGPRVREGDGSAVSLGEP